MKTEFEHARRALTAVALAMALVFGTSIPLVSAADSATISGIVVDPSGKPAAGFQVVVKDLVSGREFKSSGTTGAGEYRVTVPVGGRYKLEHVVAPDGTILPVQDVPPIPIRIPGDNSVNIRFSPAPAPAAPAAPTPAPTPAPKPAAPAPPATPSPKPATPSPKPAPASPSPAPKTAENKKKAAAPWWKRPGGVVGIILGVGAVAAIAGGGGGGSNGTPSSASLPSN